jgi:hypothetical protein
MKKCKIGIVGYGRVATAYIPFRKASLKALDTGQEMPLTSLDAAVISYEPVFVADRSVGLGRSTKISELSRYAK